MTLWGFLVLVGIGLTTFQRNYVSLRDLRPIIKEKGIRLLGNRTTIQHGNNGSSFSLSPNATAESDQHPHSIQDVTTTAPLVDFQPIIKGIKNIRFWGNRTTRRYSNNGSSFSLSSTTMPTIKPTAAPTTPPTSAPTKRPTAAPTPPPTSAEESDQHPSSIQDVTTTAYQEFHHTATAILPLRDWEQASIDGLKANLRPKINNATNDLAAYTDESLRNIAQSCHPPPGIRPTCCLGSLSHGGAVSTNYRYMCDHAFDKDAPGGQWNELQQAMANFFQENPILRSPQVNNNNTNHHHMECDVCRIVELARQQKHLNISLLGDSMHHQVMEGMLCELQRRGYILDRWTIEELQFSAADRNVYHDLDTKIEIAQFRSPHWGKDSDDQLNDLVTLKYYGLYKMPMTQNSHLFAQEMLATTQVLVLGMGLHWAWDLFPHHGADAYAPSYLEFIQQASTNSSSRVELILQRETTAQHFDIPGGDYWEFTNHKDTDSSLEYSCKKAVAGDSTCWRERYIASAIPQCGLARTMAGPNMPPISSTYKPEVITLPYYNFTERFHTMHPNNGNSSTQQDCTHCCSSPYLYYPLWRSMRLAMDRKYGG